MTPATRQFIRDRLATATDAEIAAAHAALPPLTADRIPLLHLGALLRKVGLMGTLRGIVADQNANAQLRAGVADFLDQLGDVRQLHLDTTDAVIAVRSAAVLAALGPVAQASGMTADQVAALVAAIYALGGGLRYTQLLTETDVAAERALAARETAATAAINDSKAAHDVALAINNRHASHGDVGPVTLAAPAMPEGFKVVGAGVLVPVEG